ncbi:MAG: methylenetetrahydrofolate reductase C-terminal domain-containing protein [Candidatus Omnitrophica bacterium]|nr:methylenetetrahydrofolate reductase C-terminal domain-containing protein [Candidatus Omnitrophota bacterium]
MITTKQKERSEILKSLEGQCKVFIVGCGECATACKTGGEEEVKEMKAFLEANGKVVTGFVIPDAPCVSSQTRTALGKNKKIVKESDAILVMACGLGAQCLKENLKEDKAVHVSNDTLFIGEIDREGNFLERCSACGECILELTGGICPVTRCSKGLMNGPCGGMDKGKCEVDRTLDCAWALIYNQLKEKGTLYLLKRYIPPKDYSKMQKPRSRIMKKAV